MQALQKPKKPMKRLSAATIADAWLLFITVIWSGTFALIKLALQEIPPLTFTATRFTLAFLASTLVWRSSLSSLSRNRFRQGVVLGILFGFGFYLQTLGLLFTSVGNSAFITGALVVFTPFAYWLIERKRLSIHHIISVVIVFAGLLIFVRPTAAFNIGDGLTLLSAAGWALYIVYVDVFTRPVAAHHIWSVTGQLVIVQFGVTAALGIALAVFLESLPSLYSVSWQAIGALLYTALLASVVATGIQTYYQRRTTPVRAALIFALEPVLAALLGVWILDESFDRWHWIGGTLVISGILWTELRSAAEDSSG